MNTEVLFQGLRKGEALRIYKGESSLTDSPWLWYHSFITLALD